ncbi:unnamed protein product [Rotaria magnacalcarata]|uniref:Glycosyl hydrolase family 13 catalytic domain-containing protein n=2 Tax=Rotaria magnacalcarata TaxID=392030 RepID=A0A815L5J4_9BILA|nr:unnamed protein product [Rotaria magnacalcarata]CAF1587896.1 unnamed protein product [Rotaria magnacalcarata]CAF2110799.1 unnamed protein product [Rotaria magnacalcarata]CAF3879891.1 unnamed protein product [Rotaria magnacalcarata]
MTTDKSQRDWWHHSVVYQIYPRSFFDSNGDGIGDINGIIKKLDYLKKLGIDIVWLSPVYDSPNHDNGYDIRDYTKIMTEFGTMADFDLLLKEMKKRELKLVMDLVVNHTSDEHPWFIESKKGKDNPYRHFYHWQPSNDGHPPNRWGACFGGLCWTYDSLTCEYYLHTFTEKQPDLNWANPLVREEVYKLMRWWLDKGVDGFRMDVINFISKTDGYPEGAPIGDGYHTNGSPYFINGPHVHEYIQEMNEKVLRHYNIVTVGECPGAHLREAELFSSPDRNELNMIFTFEHMNLDGSKWEPKLLDLRLLKHHFTVWQQQLYGRGWNSLYWNNHDQPRIVSRWGNDSAQYRVLSAKMLATCLHFLRGTPYIYQGEEIGMTNVRFPTLADYRDIETINFHRDALESGFTLEKIMAGIYAKSRDNARTPMQWSGNLPHGGFTNGQTDITPWIKVNPNYTDINVEQALNDPQSTFYYYQKLIELRRQMTIIVHGKYDIFHKDNRHIFIYKRYNDEGHELIIACNFSMEPTKIADSQLSERLKNHKRLLISNYEQDNKSDWLDFRPYEAWALEIS